MKRCILLTALFALAITQSIPGQPYEVAYEGDVFPEQEGWDRFTSGGGVQRSLQNGVFQLDTTDPSTADNYFLFRNEDLNAGPGETFSVEWRLRLCPEAGIADVVVYIAADAAERDINIGFSTDQITSFFDGNFIFIDTTVFRTYRIVSFDMVNYSFFIDDELFYTGFFDAPGIISSAVRFGDCCVPQASCSDWDYFRFGVVKQSDLNFDGTVNLLDFATFARCFDLPTGSTSTTCSDIELFRSDLDGNGLINLADFASFASQFGT